MAPGRKRGAKGAKTTSELSLGDLVLAKVKGFPAWPAKISRPEDWKRAPDPKKYFVQFFGTEEIAFVAPADIQAFTSEAKNKLSARCQGKTVKFFAQAVKEICEEFDELQRKNASGLRDEMGNEAHGTDAASAGMVRDNDMEVDAKDVDRDSPGEENDMGGLKDDGPTLERCSQRQNNTDLLDRKPCILDDSIFLKKASKCSNNGINLVDVVESGSHSPRNHSLGEGSHDGNGEDDIDDRQKEGTNEEKPKLVKKKSKGMERVHKISGSAAPSLAGESGRYISISGELAGDDIKNKIEPGMVKKELPSDVLKSGLGTNSIRKVKKVVKDEKQVVATDDLQDEAEYALGEENKLHLSDRKLRVKSAQQKQTSRGNEVQCPAKRSKIADLTEDSSKSSMSTSRSVASPSPSVIDVKLGSTELKRSVVRAKAEIRLGSGLHSSAAGTNVSGDENVLPPTKRHRQSLEAMSGFSESRTGKSYIALKNDFQFSENARSPVNQPPIKRRAVRLCDDEEEEEPRTPIHGGSVKTVSDSTKRGGVRNVSTFRGQPSGRTAGTIEDDSLKKLMPSSRTPIEDLSPNSHQVLEKRPRKNVFDTHGKVEVEKVYSREPKPIVASPKSSPHSIAAAKTVEPYKPLKNSDKSPGNAPQKKASAGSSTSPLTLSGSLNNQQINDISRPTFSGERTKSTPKSELQMNDSVLVSGDAVQSNSISVDRLEGSKDDKMSYLIDSKSSDTVMSMKHLIAAAQAKRRQAHTQNIPVLGQISAVPGRSPSPATAAQSVALSTMGQFEGQGIHFGSSPASDSRQYLSLDQPGTGDLEEKGVSCGQFPAGGSLSGDTEAVVARDAFEGMIETLSRTKESIGRATRLAIDCAKYGIANEVVELLIRKLENEPSFHRKVDLFFLVDSITQCSHSHKGIAGASYIPTVQAALPRLLGAAAPAGASARENRRQCLKVLRLWLERKILPESILKRYMEDIGAANDDASAGFSLRRPSRAERAIDDPIREMEGMLVDEYGSNATFQLPGFFSSHVFEEEEEDVDVPKPPVKHDVDVSPTEHTSSMGGIESYQVTSNDRRHCILEDVDGELEMEDVSVHPKDEQSFFTNEPFEIVSNQPSCENILDGSSTSLTDMPPLPPGSPPLPDDSPPVTPPLPSSPLPPLSPPPPPPPPPFSPSPPPPPPPPPPSLPYPLPPPPLGPPLAVPVQPSFLPQTSIISHNLQPLPSSMPLSTPAVAYQQPLPHEISCIPSGNHLSQMVANIPHVPHIDTNTRNEGFQQQSHSYITVGVGNSRDPAGYSFPRPLDYGRGDAYLNTQPSHPNPQFQPPNAPFMQRPLHPNPNPPPQQASTHFSYPQLSVQQHPQHAYPPPYAFPTVADGPRRYVGDEQRRMLPNEYNADHQHGMWMAGGRSCSGPSFAPEGYFRPPPERPPTNSVSFQPSGPNLLPASAPIPGHGLLFRPEMSSHNWRPA